MRYYLDDYANGEEFPVASYRLLVAECTSLTDEELIELAHIIPGEYIRYPWGKITCLGNEQGEDTSP